MLLVLSYHNRIPIYMSSDFVFSQVFIWEWKYQLNKSCSNGYVNVPFPLSEKKSLPGPRQPLGIRSLLESGTEYGMCFLLTEFYLVSK